MTWNIASAKQQFSEVVRLTAQEPQAIYNRDKPVAVLVSATEFEAFKHWQQTQLRPSMNDLFAEIRGVLAADGEDGIEIAPRTNRASPFDDPDFLNK
jgi:prevent-host-death family protein